MPSGGILGGLIGAMEGATRAAYPHAERRDIEGAAAKGLHLPTDALAGTSSLHPRTERAQSQSHDDYDSHRYSLFQGPELSGSAEADGK